MRDLVDTHYPNADCIRVVLDNLSTHKPAALYEAFAPTEARRILRRLELHYTPKHASWLHMVEIEIGVMVTQCLDHGATPRAGRGVNPSCLPDKPLPTCAVAAQMGNDDCRRHNASDAARSRCRDDVDEPIRSSVAGY